jgi:hypothetical protein
VIKNMRKYTMPAGRLSCFELLVLLFQRLPVEVCACVRVCARVWCISCLVCVCVCAARA